LRLDASRRLGVVDTRSFRMLNRVFAWTILPLPLVGSALLCASFAASHIAWAHVRYTVDKTGRVLRVERDSETRQGETDAVADCLYPAESSQARRDEAADLNVAPAVAGRKRALGILARRRA
jgi:hypothetical protein